MSIYDDTDDCSGTMLYTLTSGKEYWAAADPNAARYSKVLKYGDFLRCVGCSACLDNFDIVTGDFGDLHCVYCGSDDISY